MTTIRILSRRAGTIPALVLSALALVSLAAVAAAQQYGAGDGQQGPAARAVRLSYVDGAVQVAQDGQPLAENAVANMPLVQGMTLSSGDDGKAEIQFEDGSVARLSPDSALTLAVLSGSGTSGQAEVSVDRGLGYFELQGTGQSGPIRVRFGGSVATGSGFTILRVENDTPPGAVAVMTGNARIEGANGLNLDLHSGQWVDFAADGPRGYSISDAIPTESWDAWNADRDQALNEAAANQTAAPGELAPGQAANPAWSDLDANGSWYNVPGEGYVWSPYDASNAGFDPYGNGNWVWMPRYGYVWVSGYSWGYMPFSCGMWNYYDNFGWGWAPGYSGCSPWWSTGVYFGPRFGRTPGWYNPVRRPVEPSRPWRGRPVPLIPVRSRGQFDGPRLPSRDRNTPVTIGGATVVGLRPFPGSTAPRHGVVVRGDEPGSRGTISRPGNLNPRPIYNQPNPGEGNGSGQRPGANEPGQRQNPVTAPPTGNRGTWAPSPTPTPSAPSQTPEPTRPWSNTPRPYNPPTNSQQPSSPPATTPRTYNPPPAAAPQPVAPQPTAPRTYSPPVAPPPAPSAPRVYTPPVAAPQPVAPQPTPPRTYSPPVAAPPPPAQPRSFSPPPSAPSRPSGGNSGGGGHAPASAPSGGNAHSNNNPK